MIGRRIEQILFVVIVALLLAVVGGGCVDAATRALIADANNKTAAQLADVKNQAKLAAEKAKEATDRAEAAAKAKPTAHPVELANIVIAEVHKPLIGATIISWAAGILGIALIAASKVYAVINAGLAKLLGAIGWLAAPIGITMGVCFGAMLLLLGWSLWILLGGIVTVAAIFIVRHAQDIKNLFALHKINASAIKTLAAAPGGLNAPLAP